MYAATSHVKISPVILQLSNVLSGVPELGYVPYLALSTQLLLFLPYSIICSYLLHNQYHMHNPTMFLFHCSLTHSPKLSSICKMQANHVAHHSPATHWTALKCIMPLSVLLHATSVNLIIVDSVSNQDIVRKSKEALWKTVAIRAWLFVFCQMGT